MSKNVNLGKVWSDAADTAVMGVAGLLGTAMQVLDYLTGNTQLQQELDDMRARCAAEIAIIDKKKRQLVEFRKNIPVTDLGRIPGRPNTRFIGLVTSSSGHTTALDAWLDFFTKVAELGGEAAIGVRIHRSRGGYIDIQGNALAPLDAGQDASRRQGPR